MLLSAGRSAVLRTNVLRRSLPVSAPSAPKPCRSAYVQTGEPFAPREQNPEPNPNLSLSDLKALPEDVSSAAQAEGIDPLYLFGRFMDWENGEEPSAAWEILAAARSAQAETRAQARALLSSSRHLVLGAASLPTARRSANIQAPSCMENDMSTPYGLEITESCSDCTAVGRGFFCNFSEITRQAWDEVTHKSTLPAGAILFVEGQIPRGMFVICSGRVNLSTTSKEGKLLLLKTAEAGDAVGLSATISGLGYEVTAETATPCQVSFIDRNHVLELMQTRSEFGMQSARWLSRGFHEAYHDIRDLMLSKTSAGKLARLLLSQSSPRELDGPEVRVSSAMTHEEMAHRIGASRETVTRLLTDLKKKQLIRLDGPTLVIRDRTALEALTI